MGFNTFVELNEQGKIKLKFIFLFLILESN